MCYTSQGLYHRADKSQINFKENIFLSLVTKTLIVSLEKNIALHVYCDIIHQIIFNYLKVLFI